MMDLIYRGLELLHHVLGGQVDLIYCQPKEVINHAWEQLLKQARRLLKAWISVDLNQPDIEVVINKEVKSKQLEAVLASIWVDLLLYRSHSHRT